MITVAITVKDTDRLEGHQKFFQEFDPKQGETGYCSNFEDIIEYIMRCGYKFTFYKDTKKRKYQVYYPNHTILKIEEC
jgi:hypothetical protein